MASGMRDAANLLAELEALAAGSAAQRSQPALKPAELPFDPPQAAKPPGAQPAATATEPAAPARPSRGSTAKPLPATSVEGHRGRMRQRLLEAGPDALADHELLEMMLFLALPRRDTKPIARALLREFGSFAAAIAAPVPALLRVEGMGEAGAAALKTIHAAALRLARAEIGQTPVLSAWDKLIDYLHSVMAREKIEQFRILFLDAKNRVLADEAQSRGTVNHTPVYPREVVRRALELHACAIVMAHNHPSGDPQPSQDDIVMTRRIDAACEAVGIRLHDHVIVGNGTWLSLRQKGLI